MAGDPLALSLASSAVWIAAAVIAHFALLHWAPVERRARALVGVFVGAAAGHAVTAMLLGAGPWRAVYGVVLVFCAFILYGPFYYTIAASFSVRILVDLAGTPGGLAPDELRRRYPVDDILAGRLRTLVASGYLWPSGSAFALSPKGAAIARPFRLVKALWRLGPGG